MPLFDMRCLKCEHIEKDQFMRTDDVLECPKCEDKPHMERMMGSFARIKFTGMEYAGTGSGVERFEILSKEIETVDSKRMKPGGGVILKGE